MKNILEMHEFLLNERRASALTLLNDVVGGRTSSVEGIKLSVGMASAFLDWMRMSPYGKKYSKLPFNMLFTAAFVWGLDRYVKGKDLKDEYKELKAKAKEMRKNESVEEGYGMYGLDHNDTMGILDIAAQYTSDAHAAANQMWRDVDDLVSYLKSDHIPRKYHKAFDKSVESYKKRHKLESVSVDEKRSTPYGEIMLDLDAAMKKAIKKGVTNLGYARDYVKSLERMAKKNAKQFFKDYGDFSEDDWIEDVRYNMANENVQDAAFNLDKIFGDDQESIQMFQDIEDNGTWKDMVNYIEEFGNEEMLSRYGIRSTAQVKKLAKHLMRESVNEALNGYQSRALVDAIANQAKVNQVLTVANLSAKKLSDGRWFFTSGPRNLKGVQDIETTAKAFGEYNFPELDGEYIRDLDFKIKGSGENTKIVDLKLESKVNEIRAKKVTKQMWKKFSDDKRFDALLSVIKDPDDAEEYVFMRWEKLPGWMQRDMTLFEKDYSTEQRKEMAAKGLALPDGSFPIKDIKDLKNAILSYGRSTDHSEVAKFIAKRAKALGAEDLIPDTENFQKALKETDKKGEYIPYYEAFKESLLEKKPKGAPDFHHSDAPDAEGRFRDLSPKDLAAWLIKTRKKDLKKISGSLTQQVVFNRNDDPKYADKMEKTRIEVYKQLGRDDLLDKKD